MPPIDLLILDIDGTLTDGTIVCHADGTTSRGFHIRDGMGLRLWREAGGRLAVITAKASPEIRHRLKVLQVEHVVDGCDDKAAGLERVLREAGPGAAAERTAYLGDDLLDLPAMRRVAYPMAVADAAPEVRAAAKYVTQLPGGRGAAREAVEHLLRAAGRWEAVVAKYMGG